MKRSTSERRRKFLALLSAFPISLLSRRSSAQPKQLKLACYYLPETLQGRGAQLFADKIGQKSAGAIQVSIETSELLISLDLVVKESALAVFCAPCIAKSEPVLGLSVLPMIAATFEEAETLLRIARPHYSAALARHGQVLLATQPWLPGALWSTIPIRSVADLKGIAFALAPTPSIDAESGWRRPFVKLGARSASYSDAEMVLSSEYTGNMKFTQEFAYFTELFYAAQLTFLTAKREIFDSLPETQRHVLVGEGHNTELALWKLTRERLPHRRQQIAERGVRVSAQPPADVVAALRKAAEPDIQSWVQSVGGDGAAILTEYRRAIGRD
jgi:TRAP-type C4-dicarboxylate transport system substrate-binding protein